jgi:hypothetical protein
MLQPVTGGKLGDAHNLVKVSRRSCTLGGDLWIMSISSILGIAHLVPLIRAEPNEWFVNSQVDLWTFNWVY